MKKIISLLSATIMAFSFTTVSFAAENLTIEGSKATVAVGATEAVDVTFTFTFPGDVSLLGFQPEIAFDKTALTLNSFDLSGDVDWTTTDSNTGAAYGAYLSFDDTNYVGTTATDEYVLTLNFTVKDTSAKGAYDVTLQKLVGTDGNWAGLADSYTWDSNVKATITVGEEEETTETKYFAATLNWGAKAKASTGVEFSFEGADNTAKVPFGTTFEDASDVTVGLEVTDVPSDATLTLSNVAWY